MIRILHGSRGVGFTLKPAVQAKLGPLELHMSTDCVWLRLFGYGAALHDRAVSPPLFAARNGGEYRIGRFGLGFLHPPAAART